MDLDEAPEIVDVLLGVEAALATAVSAADRANELRERECDHLVQLVRAVRELLEILRDLNAAVGSLSARLEKQ